MQKNLINKTIFAAVGTLTLAGVASAQSVYSDDFSADTTANYATDRANPGGFTIAGGVLTVANQADGSTGNFDDFQGIRTVTDLNAVPVATASVDLLVDTAFAASTTTRAGILFARIDNPAGGLMVDYYPTIGVYNFGAGPGVVVSSGAPGGFDGDPATPDANMQVLGVTPVVGSLNTLGLQFTSTGVNYLFNGAVVASDTNNAAAYGSAIDLDSVLLNTLEGSESYAVTFDNLNVTVPEPASLGLIGVAGLGLLRRRRAAAN